MFYSFNFISFILTLLFIENVNGFLWDLFSPFSRSSLSSYDNSEDGFENYFGRRRHHPFRPKSYRRRPYWDLDSDEDNNVRYIILPRKPKPSFDPYYDADESNSREDSYHHRILLPRRQKDDYLENGPRKCRGKSSLQSLWNLLLGFLNGNQRLPQMEKPGKKKDMYIHVELPKKKLRRKRLPRNERKFKSISFGNPFTNLGSEFERWGKGRENFREKRSSERRKDPLKEPSHSGGGSLASQFQSGGRAE
uniref:Uncharacterized protein n=1 Tax=Strongyloides stercoralis TaxID=6248 RepID=A0A0K0EEY8_STRER